MPGLAASTGNEAGSRADSACEGVGRFQFGGMSVLSSWVLAARPKTLPAAVAPVAMGGALTARLTGTLSWPLLWYTLGSAMAIQVATNFFNDAIDAAKGADRAGRLGPVRATAAGLVSGRQMYLAAVVALLVSGLLALPLLAARGWVMLVIGLPSVYFSFGYTGGPWPLAYRGWGDGFVLLYFGLVAVSGTVFVQCGRWPWEALVAGAQVGMLSTVLIAVNNLRDAEEDRISQKRTLAVRYGTMFSRVEIALLCLLPHVLGLLVWPLRGWGTLAWWPLPVMLLGGWISWSVWRTEPSRKYNLFLALAGLQLVLFAVLWVLGSV